MSSWRKERDRCYMRLFNGRRCPKPRSNALIGEGFSAKRANYCTRHLAEYRKYGPRKEQEMPLPLGSFAGVKESDFTALTGTFDGVIESAEHRDATGEETLSEWERKHPGEKHPGYVSWTIADLRPAENPDDETYTNRKAWHNTTLDPEKRGMLLAMLLAIGYEREEVDAKDFSIELEDQAGKRVRVRLGPQAARRGRPADDTRHEVKAVMRVGERAGSLLD